MKTVYMEIMVTQGTCIGPMGQKFETYRCKERNQKGDGEQRKLLLRYLD